MNWFAASAARTKLSAKAASESGIAPEPSTTAVRSNASNVSLIWANVDLDRGVLAVRNALGSDRKGGFFVKPPKGNRTRSIALVPAAIDALRKERAAQAADKLAPGASYVDRGLVFADAFGAPLHPDSFSKAFQLYARAAKINGATLHSTRHSVATWAIAGGGDIRSVQAILGHSVASTTLNIYAGAVVEAQEGVVATVGDVLARAQAQLTAEANSASAKGG
jgi:integrase